MRSDGVPSHCAGPMSDRPADTQAWLRCVRSSFGFWDVDRGRFDGPRPLQERTVDIETRRNDLRPPYLVRNARVGDAADAYPRVPGSQRLSLIHISEPTR